MGFIFGPDDGDIVEKNVSDDYKRMLPELSQIRELPSNRRIVRTFDHPRKAYRFFDGGCIGIVIIPADTTVVYSDTKIRVEEAYIHTLRHVNTAERVKYAMGKYSGETYHCDTWYKVAGGVNESTTVNCNAEGIYVCRTKRTARHKA